MNWIKHDYGSKAGTWTASLGILDFVVFPEDRVTETPFEIVLELVTPLQEAFSNFHPGVRFS